MHDPKLVKPARCAGHLGNELHPLPLPKGMSGAPSVEVHSRNELRHQTAVRVCDFEVENRNDILMRSCFPKFGERLALHVGRGLPVIRGALAAVTASPVIYAHSQHEVRVILPSPVRSAGGGSRLDN